MMARAWRHGPSNIPQPLAKGKGTHTVNTTAPAEVREIPFTGEILQGHIQELRLLAGEGEVPEWMALFVVDGGEYDGLPIWTDPIDLHDHSNVWGRARYIVALCQTPGLGRVMNNLADIEDRHADDDVTVFTRFGKVRLSSLQIHARIQRKNPRVPGISQFLSEAQLAREARERGEREHEAQRAKRHKDVVAEIYGDDAYIEPEPLPDDWDDDSTSRGRGRPSKVDTKREEIAAYLSKNPDASGNEVFSELGGTRSQVMKLVKEIREAGTENI